MLNFVCSVRKGWILCGIIATSNVQQLKQSSADSVAVLKMSLGLRVGLAYWSVGEAKGEGDGFWICQFTAIIAFDSIIILQGGDDSSTRTFDRARDLLKLQYRTTIQTYLMIMRIRIF